MVKIKFLKYFYLPKLLLKMAATLLSDSINFKMANVIHPTYQFNKQTPNEGSTFSVTNTQGPITTFQLSPSVFNLSKSKLIGTLMLTAQGAGNYSWINVNGFKLINHITINVMNGPQLLDLQQADIYFDTVTRRNHSFSDVQSWDCCSTYAAANTGTSFFEGLIPSNFATANSVRLDNTALAKAGQESEYLTVGGANAATYLDFKIGLDKIVDTILAVDHDLYFKSNLTITITWNNLTRYCWLGTSAANPSTGAANLAVAGCQILNPTILLAVEQNPILKHEIMERATSQNGLILKMPHVFTNNFTTNAAGANNFQGFYNSGQGTHIKKIYWTAYQMNPASVNLFYDKSALAGAKITQFSTTLDSVALQQFPYVVANGDGFLSMRDSLRSSDILSFNEHLYNWCHIEDFTSDDYRFLKTLFPEVPKDNLIDGIPLGSVQRQWVVNSTTASAITNWVFTVFLRTLRIAGDMTTVE